MRDQSSTLGKPGSVPRNKCITVAVRNGFPEDCGYPQILGTVAGKEVYLNATATIGADGSSLVFTATAPKGFTRLETSCVARLPCYLDVVRCLACCLDSTSAT